MAYEQGMLEMALAAAVGNDPALVLELRTAFLESAEAHFTALEEASGDVAWQMAALRLKGLAASFGASDLFQAIDALVEAAPGDGPALARVRQEIDLIAA